MTQRDPREHWPGFLAFLRAQPCISCGTRQNVEASHIRMGDRLRGVPACVGLQIKPHDRWAVPLCDREHRLEPTSIHGSGNEAAFWRRVEINPFLAAEYYQTVYRTEQPNAPAPYVKGPRKIKPRKPRNQRAKVKGRTEWPKQKMQSARSFSRGQQRSGASSFSSKPRARTKRARRPGRASLTKPTTTEPKCRTGLSARTPARPTIEPFPPGWWFGF